MSNTRNLAVVTEKLNIMMDNLVSLSNIYFGSSELRNLLLSTTTSNSNEQRLKKEFVSRMIVNYKYAFTWLDYDVSILGFNGLELHSMYEGQLGLEHFTSQPWYQEVVRQDGKNYVLLNDDSVLAKAIGEEYYVTVARILKDYESGRNIGLLLVSVKESFIYSQIKSSIEDFENIIITDASGNIITASDKSMLGISINNTPYHSYGDGRLNDADGVKQMVSTYSMPTTGWNFIMLSPYDNLFAKLNHAQKINWAVFAMIIGLGIFLSYIIARRLSVPIKSLYVDMMKVENGDLSVRSKLVSNDEIGFLAFRFNHMISRIQGLHQELFNQQEQKRRAELEMLKAQINTHFLFNTLASIRSMVVTGNAQQADTVIVSLVKLLRRTLSAKSEFVQIQNEIDHLKHYLTIQKARMGDTFDVQWELNEDILSYKMLHMLLQSLVENALFHGIEPLKEKGFIYIRAYLSTEDKDSVVIEIIDNGVGLQSSSDQLERTPGTGTGLSNIRNRLNLHFGDDGELRLERIHDAYTKATITFPAFRNEKELKRR